MGTKLQVIGTYVALEKGTSDSSRIDLVLDKGLVKIRDKAPRPLANGALWSEQQDRSYGRLSHGFVFTEDWVKSAGALSPERRRQLMDVLQGMLRDWPKIESEMAFHDETTAQRVMKLAAVHEVFGDELTEEQKGAIVQRISADTELLTSEAFYAGNNNHGMFQNLALLAVESLVPEAIPSDGIEHLALNRLAEYFDTCFTSDGVHVENSPSYHLMVSRYLKRFVDYVRASESDFEIDHFEQTIRDAEVHAAYSLTPTGYFAPVSDTSHVVLTAKDNEGAYPGDTFLGAVTHGAEGTPPSARAYVAEASGYAIHRESFTSKDSSYVLFSAAYNADYHKHSDEMSLYVAVDGREILREAGPFGYDRRSPFTAYGFSSFAHNTLIIDGVGLPRTDRESHATFLVDHGSGTDTLDVEGITRRFRGVEWRRRVRVAREGARKPIPIVDSVRADAEREFAFLWHFAPGLNLHHRGDSILATDTDGPVASLSWRGADNAAVEIIVGRLEPRPQGWAFPQMGKKIEAPVAEVTVSGREVDVEWTFELLPRPGARTSLTGVLRRLRGRVRSPFRR